MGTVLIHSALFLAGLLALAGFASHICRGRPAPRLTRRQARERRALKEIEYHLFTQVGAAEGDNSRQID